jgi:hydrogenase maturation protease
VTGRVGAGRRRAADGGLLILGVGNVLMGDEGVGVHAARVLEGEPWPPGVTVIDGGTGGFHLLSWLSDHDTVVLIDATLDGRPPGTVSVSEPRYASDFPRSLSAHDIGLRDLIESAALLGELPRMHLVTVSVSDVQPMRLALSAAVENAIPRVVALVRSTVERALEESAGDRRR